MSSFNYLAVLLVLSLFSVLDLSHANTGPTHDKLVVCYVGTWAVYRPTRGSFTLEHIDPSLCTHLIYSFAGLNVTTDGIRSLDPWQDLSENYGKGGYNRITKLKDRYPHLKVSLAIGGWNEGSSNYSMLTADADRRGRFVANAVDFIRKYNFDGLDLDWEFPGKRGGSPSDKLNFLLLVKELRASFKKFNLLLTAAFGAGKDTIDIAYDVEGLGIYLDFIHLMCYDYHGAWDMKTGANAPLSSTDVYNVEYTIQYMKKMGAPLEKMILGLPLYGRTFLLPETSVTENRVPKLGEVARNFGFQGPYTRENGFMGYNEICVELKNTSWSKHWDSASQTPFAVNREKVIAYDDPRSILAKIKYALEQGLGGAMVWSIDTDDFHGDCATDSEAQSGMVNFPLMRSINTAIVDTLADIERNKANVIPRGEEHSSDAVSAHASCAVIVGVVTAWAMLV